MKTTKLQTSNFSVFRIPRPEILDSQNKMFATSGLHKQNYPDSGIWVLIHGVKLPIRHTLRMVLIVMHFRKKKKTFNAN